MEHSKGLRAGISTPVTKKFIFHCDVDWMKRVGVRGIVIWNHILFAMPADEIPRWLFRHELEHVYQQIQLGRPRFYLLYFYYSLRYGYNGNPFEVQAYNRQILPLQNSEEQALWKLREI